MLYENVKQKVTVSSHTILQT
uniref:Uncharacterized protein n=1 Tax=Rhizophora mucronata TaxID=61149 RepID=A0A2P2N147_RHIMU